MPKGKRGEAALTLSVPTGAVLGNQPWRCSADYWQRKSGMCCACPGCMADRGLTLVWNAEDMGKEIALALRRFQPASLKTAMLAPHLICPGYKEYLDALEHSD